MKHDNRSIPGHNAACNTGSDNEHRYYYSTNGDTIAGCETMCNACGNACLSFVDAREESPAYCVFKSATNDSADAIDEPGDDKDVYDKP